MRQVLASCALGLLLVGSPSVRAQGLDCSRDEGVSRIGCWALKTVIIGAGSVVIAESELKSAVLPGVDVMVRSPGVEPFPGKLTHAVTSGRTIKNGDFVDLVCTVNKRQYQFDILPALKDGDSHGWRLMS
jgi:hypothetical protein